MFVRSLILALAGALLLVGCASQPTAPGSATETILAPSAKLSTVVAPAVELERQGKYLEAALLYTKLSGAAASPERQDLQLRAVSALLAANLYSQAKLILKDIDATTLSDTLSLRFGVLSTRVALAERRPEDALAALAQLSPGADAPVPIRKEIQTLRISALELAGKTMEAVRGRVALAALLTDKKVIDENQRAILRLLSSLPEQSLQENPGETPDPVLSGWIELAVLTKKYPDPLRLAQQLQEWRTRFPQHPATDALIASFVPQQQDIAMRLDHIALILPLEGVYAKAAAAVRDGFVASYYGQETASAKPTIRIYDTSGAAGDVQSVYQQAIDEGATIVVGPLNKDAVNTLAHGVQLRVPTLALNYVEDGFYAENLYQFGLSPEDEARQTADRAWLDGHSRAAILFPDGNWGERVAAAFTQRWEELGGTVATSKGYNQEKSDFSTPIRDLLNIEESNERFRGLTRLLHQSLRFEPRRRQDIDFIFMAAFPRQARLVAPQLKFHHAAGLPVYTTSHAYTGKKDRSADRDMNGVIIGDMPWVLAQKGIHPVRKDVFRAWPESAGQFSRLYAMGVDAYNVLYYLNWLRANPQAQLRGATGVLYMDATNQIHRQLTWAQFRSGAPRPIGTSPVLSAK